MNVTNNIHTTHNVKLSINRLVPGSPPMTPGAQGGGWCSYYGCLVMPCFQTTVSFNVNYKLHFLPFDLLLTESVSVFYNSFMNEPTVLVAAYFIFNTSLQVCVLILFVPSVNISNNVRWRRGEAQEQGERERQQQLHRASADDIQVT